MAGKKNKGTKAKAKGAKAKGPTTDVAVNADDIVTAGAVDKNITVGEACFWFCNKDHYVGGYRASRTPMDAVREGLGEYRSRDGHVYTGTWAHDLLVGEAETKFPDHSRHVGLYEQHAYCGAGAYHFADQVVVSGEFGSRPLGELLLTDPGGRRWAGQAEEAGATFVPVNRFLPTEDHTNRFHRKSSLLPGSPGRRSSSANGSAKASPRSSLKAP